MKDRRKTDKQQKPEKKRTAERRSEFLVRPAGDPQAPVDENDPLVRAIGDLLINDWQKEWKQATEKPRTDADEK